MFKPFADFYYSLPDEKKRAFSEDFIGKYVHWSGIIVETWQKAIVIYGGDNYGNESWSDMGYYDSLNHMLPYTFLAVSNERVTRYKKGSKVSITGKIVSRGDKDLFLHWKLKDIQVVDVEEPA